MLIIYIYYTEQSNEYNNGDKIKISKKRSISELYSTAIKIYPRALSCER